MEPRARGAALAWHGAAGGGELGVRVADCVSQVVEEEEGIHLDDFSWREKDFSDLIGKKLLAIMDNCKKHI